MEGNARTLTVCTKCLLIIETNIIRTCSSFNSYPRFKAISMLISFQLSMNGKRVCECRKESDFQGASDPLKMNMKVFSILTRISSVETPVKFQFQFLIMLNTDTRSCDSPSCRILRLQLITFKHLDPIST